MDLQNAKAVIVVFIMDGCGACHEYTPMFQKVAREFAGKIPAFILDVNSQQGGPLADQYGIEATPTTLVMRKPAGALKAEGALNEAQIRQLFTIAAAQQ